MFIEDLALNNLQFGLVGSYGISTIVWSICMKPNKTKSYIFNIYMYKEYLALNNPQ